MGPLATSDPMENEVALLRAELTKQGQQLQLMQERMELLDEAARQTELRANMAEERESRRCGQRSREVVARETHRRPCMEAKRCGVSGRCRDFLDRGGLRVWWRDCYWSGRRPSETKRSGRTMVETVHTNAYDWSLMEMCWRLLDLCCTRCAKEVSGIELKAAPEDRWVQCVADTFAADDDHGPRQIGPAGTLWSGTAR